MDYTTLARVKSEAGMLETDVNRDALLSSLITAASRAIDRFCTGQPGPASDDYLALATITDETLIGYLTADGNAVFYAHKPAITTITAAAFRFSPAESWQSIDVATAWCDQTPIITLYAGLMYQPTRVIGKLTYTGGLAASVTNLPGDVIEAATILAIRYYREAQTGLTDQIGVADLGVLLYTKAMPDRVRLLLQPYTRLQPWRLM